MEKEKQSSTGTNTTNAPGPPKDSTKVNKKVIGFTKRYYFSKYVSDIVSTRRNETKRATENH